MSRAQRHEHIDLFDDPSWESADSREEAAAYGRLVASWFSPRVEWLVLVFSVSVWFLGLAALVLLCLSLSNLSW
jgi:hypothetical protein